MSFTNDQPIQTAQLPISIEFSTDPKKNQEILSLNNQRISTTVNGKTGGLHSLVELANSNQFFNQANTQSFRNVYRKCFDMVNLNGGNIAGGATVTFPHNINGLKFSALIYASCTSVTPEYFTVVYPNAKLSSTNVTFTNPLPATAISSCYVVAEYLKV